jgi:hypothetical protein
MKDNISIIISSLSNDKDEIIQIHLFTDYSYMIVIILFHNCQIK